MAWSKYQEDNMDAITDRLYDMNHCDLWDREVRKPLAKQNPVWMRKICKCCGRGFDITMKEFNFYLNKEDWQFPKRCKDCRKDKKKSTKITDRKKRVV